MNTQLGSNRSVPVALAVTLMLVAATQVVAYDSPAGDVSAPTAPTATTAAPRGVDVVVLLDTSGSMDNLLDAVRARLWDVVNELGRMKPTPELRVGLVTYGTNRSTEERGWVQVEEDLTNDLDAVYADLMALGTGGHVELLGRALHIALEEMDWSLDNLRIVFVAGNESADQGSEAHDFLTMTRFAREDGVIVNALYAGNREQAIVEKWPEIASAGNGNFAAIDPELSTIQIATPHDAGLLKLNAELNRTYLPYGPRGAEGLANQTAQDGNASRLGIESCSSRIVAKGTALYTNATWDLVDAALQADFSWDTIDPADLPQAMRSLSVDERTELVRRKREEREAIQTSIQELSEARELHIRSVREGVASGLGAEMRRAVCEQAVSRGFETDGC